ncbi:hypothetical protein Pla144_34120 [Bythopirellula polymerisocia]|uniref:Uncharacterized protein n=1 Tax=Bythopirellula polymerisocia TaxID=2528003 RepID=A0A5C6CJA1_9BACT|nr:hypothetical protein Pla144_34120 [Bythopirellula polymerisocia]
MMLSSACTRGEQLEMEEFLATEFHTLRTSQKYRNSLFGKEDELSQRRGDSRALNGFSLCLCEKTLLVASHTRWVQQRSFCGYKWF